MYPLSHYFRTIIADIRTEADDLRQYILHDPSLEAAFTRAIIAAIAVIAVGSLIVSACAASAPVASETGAYILNI